MKGISLLIAGGLVFSSVSFATDAKTATSLSSNWVCSTNASSSDATSDQTADKTMAGTPKAAADSFKFAADNCRDCTKITCELNE